jgi:alkanesulfonate monooxygenase SsuD/methylene tetrahydromethanopterin reductase-like flavin-dependent oxidoreductase (luciferase family)
MVGGHGEKHLLRAVATQANWWNYGWRDDALYAHKQEVLKTHCRESGRDYDEIVQVVRVGILIAETEREIERLKTAPGVRPLSDIRLVGTPAQVTEALQRIIRQGARRLTVNFADAPRPDGTRLFTETVLPEL